MTMERMNGRVYDAIFVAIIKQSWNVKMLFSCTQLIVQL